MYAVALLLLMVLTLSACGNSGYGETPESLTVGAALQSGAETGGAQSDGTLDAADMPLRAGVQLVYDANTPGTPASVDFDIAGPWDFSNGPAQATLTVDITAAGDAPAGEDFPEAAVAAAASWAPATALPEYNFQSIDAGVWRIYGRSFTDGNSTLYTPPSQALIFPLSVGDSWTDSYTEAGAGKPVEVAAENVVLARNQLTVPAGTFDAWLLRTRVSSVSAGATVSTIDYSWFVPGIGRAAEIISQPGERRDEFTTARSFYRLTSFK